MQTRFSKQQLADPETGSSNEVLRSCVHCGFCNATCPTYVLLGDELDSPRGRIYLIKQMLESAAAPSPETVTHIDRCLSCMTTCPSGVNYMHLVDHARSYIEEHYRRPWRERLLRAALPRMLCTRWLLRSALRLSRWMKPLAPRLPAPLRRMVQMSPAVLAASGTGERAAVRSAAGSPRARVALLGGCAQAVLAPHINAAATRLLNRAGIEVTTIAGAGCCGALPHHLGQRRLAQSWARRTIRAWSEEADRRGLDAIVVTTSGCGTTIKDYGFLFRNDPAYARSAARIASLAVDITEILPDILWEHSCAPERRTVAYQPPCSLQHGQGLQGAGERLLERAGFTVRAIPESHLCCGSAGTYNLLQPTLAGRLLARKIAHLEPLQPDVIATGNIGCITQLASGTSIPVVHTVELLDWASGGPRPLALAPRRRNLRADAALGSDTVQKSG